MILADPALRPRACTSFWANVFLLFHTTRIAKRFQATVYIGNVAQTATIEDMNRVSLNFAPFTNATSDGIWRAKPAPGLPPHEWFGRVTLRQKFRILRSRMFNAKNVSFRFFSRRSIILINLTPQCFIPFAGWLTEVSCFCCCCFLFSPFRTTSELAKKPRSVSLSWGSPNTCARDPGSSFAKDTRKESDKSSLSSTTPLPWTDNDSCCHVH